MELTQRELVTILHGMLFGGFFLMALCAAIALLLEARHAPHPHPASRAHTAFLILTAALGWAAVLTGGYIVYPWYRAVAPAGANLALYPKALLIAHPNTAAWHTLGMEWKEHVAWVAPMAATTVAFLLIRQRALWHADRRLRGIVLTFAATAFLAAALAGGWGALIDKAAPVQGGATISLTHTAK